MTELNHDFLTRKQAADYLQVSPNRITALFNQGKLSGTRMGTSPQSHLRISAASIQAFLEVK